MLESIVAAWHTHSNAIVLYRGKLVLDQARNRWERERQRREYEQWDVRNQVSRLPKEGKGIARERYGVTARCHTHTHTAVDPTGEKGFPMDQPTHCRRQARLRPISEVARFGVKIGARSRIISLYR
jgi:hypothetical protein